MPNNIPQTPPATQQPQGPTVLLIEDDTLLSKMYKTKFNIEGFQVLVADEGATGLKLALEQKVDFIILDIMIPKISGLDILSQLRQNPDKKNIPVIILSNLAQPEQAQNALELGAKEFLVKANVTPADVVTKVKQYLGIKS